MICSCLDSPSLPLWSTRDSTSLHPEQLTAVALKTVISLLLQHPRGSAGLGYEWRGEGGGCHFESPLYLAINNMDFGAACLIIKEGSAHLSTEARREERFNRSHKGHCPIDSYVPPAMSQETAAAQTRFQHMVECIDQPWQPETGKAFPVFFQAGVVSTVMSLRLMCNPHILERIVRAVQDSGNSMAIA